MSPMESAAGAAAGKTPYQSAPAPLPSGKPAIAAFCTSTWAVAGPSDIMPGVNFLKANAPTPALTAALVRSAAATRVPS